MSLPQGSPNPPPPSQPDLGAEEGRNYDDKGKNPEKRSFIGKLKDKFIGTKDKRVAKGVTDKKQAKKQHLSPLSGLVDTGGGDSGGDGGGDGGGGDGGGGDGGGGGGGDSGGGN